LGRFVIRSLIAMATAWLLVSSPSTAQAQPVARDTHELLNATLWVQTAAEHHVLCQMIFDAATKALDGALSDTSWTAAAEQTMGFESLPPAIIVDIDETILDNSPFAGQLVVERVPFDMKIWSDWVARSAATALPGALEFLRHAESRGVTVFYVTNRSADQEVATRANLVKLGIRLSDVVDTVLMAREKPEWGSDKSSRRALVAASYRVLLMIGDDLGDFLTGARDTPENRIALADQHRGYWGTRWFVLPNPMNGSWETALYGNQFLPDDEVLRQKFARVKAFR
jgi:5'-nucleotidase (lipoprotein e(P4) family)